MQPQTTVEELGGKAAATIPGTSAEDRIIFVYRGRTLKPHELIADIIEQNESGASATPAVLYTVITVLVIRCGEISGKDFTIIQFLVYSQIIYFLHVFIAYVSDICSPFLKLALIINVVVVVVLFHTFPSLPIKRKVIKFMNICEESTVKERFPSTSTCTAKTTASATRTSRPPLQH